MANQPHISSELHSIDRDSRSYTLGILISRLFHPIIMNIAMFLLVGYFAFDAHIVGILWGLVCISILILPTAVFFNIRLRQGAYSDEDVSNRHQRTELYVFGLVTVLIGTAILLFFGLPKPFLALLVSALLIGIVAVSINTFWKISVHAGSIASLATVATLYSAILAAVLWPCVLALGWARVRTGNHSIWQVIAGTLLSAVVILLVFRWLLP